MLCACSDPTAQKPQTKEMFAFDTYVSVTSYDSSDDGTKEPVEVGYRDGNAVLTLKHFSTYAIVVKVNDIDETIASVAGNTVTVNAPSEAASCVAALYGADGRQMAVGKSVVADDKATVTWKSVDWTKVQTLKVFFLDADDAPIGAAAEMLVKGGAE